MVHDGIYFLSDGKKQAPEFSGDRTSGEFGEIIFEKKQHGDFTFYSFTATLIKPSSFFIGCNSNEISFECVLRGAIHIAAPFNCLLARGQYNFFYNPQGKVYRFVRAGTFKLFILFFNPGYFLPYAEYYFFVSRFLQKINREENMLLSPLHGFGGHMVKNLVETVYKNPTGPGTDNLLLTAIERMKNNCNLKINALEIDKAAEDFILQPDEKYSIGALAKQMHTNPGKLKKDFKKRFRMPVISFLRKIKMEKARQLILETDMPIQEISLELGFTNPAHFSNVFKKNMGCAPRDLRKKTA
jgi:AraC-like DNA-binding protein